MNFGLSKKSNKKIKKANKPAMMFLHRIGKTPSIDWLILSFVFVCLIAVVAVWSSLDLMKIKEVLSSNQDTVSAAPAPATQTQEEQIREIVRVYEKKQADHAELLGKARLDSAAERKANPVTATSTATSTATGTPTTTGN